MQAYIPTFSEWPRTIDFLGNIVLNQKLTVYAIKVCIYSSGLERHAVSPRRSTHPTTVGAFNNNIWRQQ
jgi:hypothetical protein